MRVLVCGGRDYSEWQHLRERLDWLSKEIRIDCVIHGDYYGADGMARDWARDRGIPDIPFRADWTTLGKKAGPIRNQRMIDEGKPDLVVAFPGGKGTADMVRRAKAAGVPVREIA